MPSAPALSTSPDRPKTASRSRPRTGRLFYSNCLLLLYIGLAFLGSSLFNDVPLISAQSFTAESSVHSPPKADDLAVMAANGTVVAAAAPANCTRPAIEQFPRSLFTQQQRQAGAVLLYVCGALYCFAALAAVCDDYFVPSLEVAANVWSMSDDVAGATLLAAGSSAPELATTVFAVFVTEDDIGISGVIGSAVFNALLVIALVALLIGRPVTVRAYPMMRDSVCYLVSIVALLAVILDGHITWWEALLLVLGYVLYCLLMCQNNTVEVWVRSRRRQCDDGAQDGAKASLLEPSRPPPSLLPDSHQDETICEGASHTVGGVRMIPFEDVDPFQLPSGSAYRLWYMITLPITALLFVTVPDVRAKRWRPYYWLTFAVSVLWIGIFSYIMVWMITVIGYTMNIPDTVMGLSFVAIGVSMPDVLASVAVAKDGYADMAVSNALGSNVFDILFCMGVPWLIKTSVVAPGSHVQVDSRGVVYSTVLLLATVVFLLVSTHMSDWTLSRRYGVALLVWYALFLLVSCLIELNTFGNMNAPMCDSKF